MTKKRTKTALALTVSTLAIAVLAFAFVMHHARSSGSLPQTVDSLTVGYVYPVASTLQQMIDSADYIVIGEYTEFNSTWNMARNPDNIKEEDPGNYVEGRLYDFTVEKTIKGSIDDSSILINHRYSEVVNTTESNAVVDSEGRILKAATKSRDLSFKVASPLFIEPELDCKYILFLSKDANFGNYYAAIEPFSVKITNGKAVLQSNLINKTDAFTQQIKTSDSKELTVIIDMGGISIADEITGKALEDIIRMIEDETAKSPH